MNDAVHAALEMEVFQKAEVQRGGACKYVRVINSDDPGRESSDWSWPQERTNLGPGRLRENNWGQGRSREYKGPYGRREPRKVGPGPVSGRPYTSNHI